MYKRQVDYRIQLPKDKTASYPKHYYSLEKTSVSVEIRSKSVKYGASKKGTVDIYVSGDIRAVAAIKATIKEKIVEKHKVCDRTCYNINNTTICNETCTTYLTEHYNTLKYSLTVEDVLEILAVDLLGVIPEDDSKIVSTNKGIPVVLDSSAPSGEAFRNIAKRLLGQEVPLMALEGKENILERLSRLLRFK